MTASDPTSAPPDAESALRALLAASPLPALAVALGAELRLIAVNQRFTDLFGYGLADFAAGDSWWTRAYPEPAYRSKVQQAWLAALAQATRMGQSAGGPIEARVVCRDAGVR